LDAARSEAGDTLLEVLIALVVISLTAVAILGAFTTAIASSSEHRDLATLDSVLKSYVENASYQLGRQTTTAPVFAPCATVPGGAYSSLTTTQGNYNVSLTSIQFWQSNNTWGTACNASTQPPQAELLTATAVNNTRAGDSESLQFSVSDPNYSPATPGPPVFHGGSSPYLVTAGTATQCSSCSTTIPVFAQGWPTPALAPSTLQPPPSWVLFVDGGGGNGTIYLQPPASVSGTFSFAITATNSFGGGTGTTVSKTFTIQVVQAPIITSANTDTVTTGAPFSFTVTATGVPTPTLSASDLPTWATFADNGNGTATLAASNPVAGTYPISIGALNAGGSAPQTFTLVVNAAVAPSFTNSASTTVPYAQSFTFNVTTTGNPTPALSASGLPGWATFTDNHNGTGKLTGTPTASGTTPITFTATNAGGPTTQSFLLTVSPPSSPSITAPNATSPACVKKNTNFSFNVSGTQFQNGLTLTSSGLTSVVIVFNNSTSLTVAATSGSRGSYSFTIKNPDGGQVTSASTAIKVSTGTPTC
jgi:hypothetical protein